MPPSEETCIRLFEAKRKNSNKDWTDIAPELGYKAETAYKCSTIYPEKKDMIMNFNDEIDEDELKEFIGRNSEEEKLWETFRKLKGLIRDQKQEESISQGEIEPENGVGYLIGLGDLHIENIMSHSDKLEKDLQTIKELPNAKVVLNGDLMDNPVKYQDLNYETLAPPQEARKLTIIALKLIQEKIMCMVTGDHERHSIEQADFNPLSKLADEWEHIDLLGYHGILNLDVGDQNYKIIITHKGKGQSMYNDAHGGIRMLREVFPEAKLAIIAHNHSPSYISQVEHRERKGVMNVGTYKTQDQYSESRGFVGADANLLTPVIKLSSEREHFEFISDISEIAKTGPT